MRKIQQRNIRINKEHKTKKITMKEQENKNKNKNNLLLKKLIRAKLQRIAWRSSRSWNATYRSVSPLNLTLPMEAKREAITRVEVYDRGRANPEDLSKQVWTQMKSSWFWHFVVWCWLMQWVEMTYLSEIWEYLDLCSSIFTLDLHLLNSAICWQGLKKTNLVICSPVKEQKRKAQALKEKRN